MPDKEKYYHQRLKEFQSKFSETAKLYDHPPDRGGPREALVRKFLSDYMPKRYGITTGRVIGLDGTLSRQCDIIIYDILNCAIIMKEESGTEYQIIPAESVISVIEVKSILEAEELKSSVKNIESFKALRGVQNNAFGSFFSYGAPLMKNDDEVQNYTARMRKIIVESKFHKICKIACILPRPDETFKAKPFNEISCFLYMKREFQSDGTVSSHVVKKAEKQGIFMGTVPDVVLHTYIFTLLDELRKWNYKKYNFANYFLNWRTKK